MLHASCWCLAWHSPEQGREAVCSSETVDFQWTAWYYCISQKIELFVMTTVRTSNTENFIVIIYLHSIDPYMVGTRVDIETVSNKEQITSHTLQFNVDQVIIKQLYNLYITSIRPSNNEQDCDNRTCITVLSSV
jgi:hypothetical protein